MTTLYWVRDTAGSWYNPSNWDTNPVGPGGVGVPGVVDTVIFGSDAHGDCTISSLVEVLHLTLNAGGYTGILDFSNNNVITRSSLTLRSGKILLGNGTITCSGGFDYGNATLPDFNAQDSTVIFSNASSNADIGPNTTSDRLLNNVVITDGSTVRLSVSHVNFSIGSLVSSGGFDAREATVTTTGDVLLYGGTHDFSNTDVIVGNDFIANSPAIFSDLAGADIAVANDFTVDGTDLIGTNTWYLDVSGVATVSNATGTYSDASSGNPVTATTNVADGGNNVNWLFSGSGTDIYNASLDTVVYHGLSVITTDGFNFQSVSGVGATNDPVISAIETKYNTRFDDRKYYRRNRTP